MIQEHTHQSRPQQSMPAADRERDDQRKDGPEQEGAADEDHHFILNQIFAIDSGIGIAIFKQPADVRVEETFDRAMWIAFFVGIGMVAYMRGSPLESSAFKGHRAKHQKEKFYNRMRAKTAMRQHSMITHSHAKR